MKQIFKINFDFQKHSFSIWSLSLKKYLDFSFSDPDKGLKTTDNFENSKVYLLPSEKFNKNMKMQMDDNKQNLSGGKVN